MEMDPGEVHIWVASSEGLKANPAAEAAWLDLLNAEERERLSRFRFEKDQREFLTAHALVRRTLSKYLNEDPRSFRFVANENGKPQLQTASRIHFNLSHSGGTVVCAVAQEREVGVDVECLDRVKDSLDIADSFFARSEVAALRDLAAPHRPERFLRYWTLKEAYLKARGVGLSLPLEAIAFELLPHSARVRFEAPVQDQPATWQFWQDWVAPGRLAALALRRSGGDLKVKILHGNPP